MRVKYSIARRDFEYAEYFDEAELKAKWGDKPGFEKSIRPFVVQIRRDGCDDIAAALAAIEPAHGLHDWFVGAYMDMPDCMRVEKLYSLLPGEFFELNCDHVRDDEPVHISKRD